MRKYAIPCVISLVVAALYNIVDQIFVANADYLGSYGNAANTVGFPITVLALGKAVASTIVTMTREIVFGVFLPILMPIIWGLDGILYSFPVADILTFIIAMYFIRQTYKELGEKLGIPCYDAEILHKIAKESGFTPEYIKDEGEYASSGWLSPILSNRSMGITNQDKLWGMQKEIILDLAKKGSCVWTAEY